MAEPRFYDVLINYMNEIYAELGGGFKENIYQNALAHKLRKDGWHVDKEVNVPVIFDGVEVGTQRLDLVVSGEEPTALIEMKAVTKISPKEENQIERHLKFWDEHTGKISNGYIINVNSERFEILSFVAKENSGDDLIEKMEAKMDKI